jgi:hypothetical protein
MSDRLKHPMRFLVTLAALSFLFAASPAAAQNHTCPTAPNGDASNKCASTQFVHNSLTSGLPLTQNHIYVGNGSGIATDSAVSGDCSIVFGSPAVIRCPGTSTAGQVLANSAGAISGLTNAQLTALINTATASLKGAVPAWPNNTTSFFRGDGTYAAVAFAGLTGQAALTQLPTIGADTVLGSIAGSTPIALSQVQLTSLVNVFTTSLSGSVPAPGSVTGRVLGDDGTWHTVSGTGTVTNVQTTGCVTGGPITSTGTLTFSPACVQNYLSGLTLANDPTTDITDDISIAAGVASDSTNVDLMVLASAISQKHLNVAWAAGSNAGCLDTGSIANNSYFIWLIKNVSTPAVDVLCSLSPSAPTMPTGYTEERRIGAVIRASAANVLFTQDGNTFSLLTPIAEASGVNPASTSAFTISLTGVPIGIRVQWIGSAGLRARGATTSLLISDLATNDITPTLQNSTTSVVPISAGTTTNIIVVPTRIFTSTTGQMRGRVSARDANTFYDLGTFGWVDTRGQ